MFHDDSAGKRPEWYDGLEQRIDHNGDMKSENVRCEDVPSCAQVWLGRLTLAYACWPRIITLWHSSSGLDGAPASPASIVGNLATRVLHRAGSAAYAFDMSRGDTGTTSPERIPPVGRLEPVDLRDIWKHEALAFTPWLAQNLDRLSDALGVLLTLEAVEHSVGPFSLDILATTPDDRKVIIENQLEPSDHGHLGQCLTYAAGVGASVVVWVLPRLHAEHRAALDWLNEHTDEGIQFFGVEVSAVRIGDSLPAPIFAVEARPNDWQKMARAGTSASTSNPNWRGWDAGYRALENVPPGGVHPLV
jgi:hypothetical protein